MVWDVHPMLVERRSLNSGPPPGVRERRRHLGARTTVSTRMSKGWLTFEGQDGERRRLTPIPEIPEGWAAASTEQLRAWCDAADPAPPSRRLIE